MSPDAPDLRAIAPGFEIGGAFRCGQVHGNGHINDTYLIDVDGPPGTSRFIFQRINNLIFSDRVKLMQNITHVTGVAWAQLAAEGESDIVRRTLSLIQATGGGVLLVDGEGREWRCYRFIERQEDAMRHAVDGAVRQVRG